MRKDYFGILDYDKIKFFLCSKAKTERGIKFCGDLKPSYKIDCVKKNLSETSEAVSLITKKNSLPLKNVKNILAITKRTNLNGILSCEELIRFYDFLEVCCKAKLYFEDYEGILLNLVSKINLMYDLKLELEKKIDISGVKDYASQNLLEIRIKIKNLDIKIRDELNNIVARAKNLLQDNIFYIKNNRYCVAVKKEFKNNFAGIIHDESVSGATVFIEPKNIIDLNNQAKNLLLEEKREIELILRDLSLKIKERYKFVLRNIYAIGKLDFIFAKAELAIEMEASEPILNDSGCINLKKARHPLIDKKKVVPIDIYLGKKFIMLLITGPNTGGKTVALKTVGLLVLMAQSGLYIPAAENSEIAVFENIFVDIGDEQSIEQNLSTFSGHMKNISEIIKCANEKSLILLDEIGAGTDPTEGAAIAISILEYFLSIKSRVIATSHYSELKIFAMTNENAENASCEFDLVTLAPNYKLNIGTPGKSNAFEISKKIGLDKNIIYRAKKNLDRKNIVFEDAVRNLENMKMILEQKESELKKKYDELEILKLEFKNERDKFFAEREKIIFESKEKAEKIINEANEKSRLLLKAYRENKFTDAEKIKAELKNIKTDLNKNNRRQNFSNEKKLNKEDIKLGQKIFCVSLNQVVTVKALPNKNNILKVSAGNLFVNINLSDVRSYAKKEIERDKKNDVARKYFDMQKKMDIPTSIDIHGYTCDEAINLIEKYIDDAILANLSQIKIIHGKGMGILKKAVSDYLKKNPYVKNFRAGSFGKGDLGVTIVEL